MECEAELGQRRSVEHLINTSLHSSDCFDPYPLPERAKVLPSCYGASLGYTHPCALATAR